MKTNWHIDILFHVVYTTYMDDIYIYIYIYICIFIFL